jgi:hypothetical protein
VKEIEQHSFARVETFRLRDENDKGIRPVWHFDRPGPGVNRALLMDISEGRLSLLMDKQQGVLSGQRLLTISMAKYCLHVAATLIWVEPNYSVNHQRLGFFFDKLAAPEQRLLQLLVEQLVDSEDGFLRCQVAFHEFA